MHVVVSITVNIKEELLDHAWSEQGTYKDKHPTQTTIDKSVVEIHISQLCVAIRHIPRIPHVHDNYANVPLA